MEAIIQSVKNFLIPGSTAFLLIGVSLGVALLHLRQGVQRWGRRLLITLAVFYWLISLPLGARLLESFLARSYRPLSSVSEARGATTVVVLGGGTVSFRWAGEESDILASASVLRALEGARLYRLLGDPLVIVSGGVGERPGDTNPESLALRKAIIEAGVPAGRIQLESESHDTLEQALNLAALLEAQDIDRFVLVTSPTHMGRALSSFRAQGLNPIPSAAPLHSESAAEPGLGLLPEVEALENSRAAMREYLALVLYWLRGLFGATP